MLTVSDVMTPDVICVMPEDDLEIVYDLMYIRAIRHLPVVDAEDAIVGLLTHRDLVQFALAEIDPVPVSEKRQELRKMPVRDFMTRSVATVTPDQNLMEAAQLMLDHKFGCLPVVEGERVVGIITESDFVRLAVASKQTF